MKKNEPLASHSRSVHSHMLIVFWNIFEMQVNNKKLCVFNPFTTQNHMSESLFGYFKYF